MRKSHFTKALLNNGRLRTCFGITLNKEYKAKNVRKKTFFRTSRVQSTTGGNRGQWEAVTLVCMQVKNWGGEGRGNNGNSGGYQMAPGNIFEGLYEAQHSKIWILNFERRGNPYFKWISFYEYSKEVLLWKYHNMFLQTDEENKNRCHILIA